MADQAGRPADWEMAKENIQPLKQGRKMAKLANCLQVPLHQGFEPGGLRIRSTFIRIRNPLFTLMRIRIRILLFIKDFKVMRICGSCLQTLQGFIVSVHSPSWLPF